MCAKLTWLLIAMAALALVTPPSYAADPGQQARLERDVAEAAAGFINFCRSPEVWRYDNLRPTIMRAVAPIGTIFQPPQVPVVILSPGSPDYRIIVGQMAYLYSIYASRKQRLSDFLGGEEPGAPPVGWALPQAHDEYEEDFDEDALHVEGELDQAHGCYGRACAWAWPYVNLRPMCDQPGFEAATILNPFLAVPTIRLSEASPAYQETVAALHYWEPKIGNAKAQQKDLQDDRKSAVGAARALAAAGLQIKPPDTKVPPEEPRLAEMFTIYERIKPALRRWRKDQGKIEALVGPWYVAKSTLVALQLQAQQIQGQIAILQLKARDPREDQTQVQFQVQAAQNQLIALSPPIAAAQNALAAVENQVRQLQADQSRLAGQTDALMEAWVHQCDVLGRLGALAHKQSLPWLNQWIAEEPRLWQLYLARGTAFLGASQPAQAIADLKRVGEKVRLYDSRPKVLAFITAVQAYALCKLGDTGNGEKRFAEAKKLDSRSWVPHFFRGWSNVERRKYSVANTEFKMAVRNCDKTPQPDPREAMALLLATCPTEGLRDGEKAVEYATKACELTKGRDWICLDTLAAAYAEADDFDSAVKWANKALESAPAGNQGPIRERIALYQDKKPYRLKEN